MRGNSVRNPAEKPLDGMGLAIVNQIMNGRLLEKASKGAAFSISLPAAGWVNGVQTILDSRFLAAGYAYTVSPAAGSFSAYGQCLICAGDVEMDGAMVFRCGDTPGRDLTVNILRSEVEADEQDL